jgi:ParB family chromosome partitioning protein
MVAPGGDFMDPEKIVLVQLTLIDRPVISGRDSIDPRKIIELAESIREKGLMEPIILTPRNGRYEIVAGDRRFLAHEHLGRIEIPAIIREVDDKDIIIYRAIENLQRENLSPMEEARAYHTMRTDGGMNIQEICRNTSKHENTVRRFLKLYEMPADFQNAVNSRDVAIAVVEELIKVDDPRMRSYFLQLAVENGITQKVAEMWVSDYFKSKQGKMFENVGGEGDPNLVIEQRPVYVTCQCCSGPVEIHEAKQLIICQECIPRVKSLKSQKGLN